MHSLFKGKYFYANGKRKTSVAQVRLYEKGKEEIIVNGKNGFLVSSQKEAIEKAKLLLTNKTLRKKCTEGAEKTAELFRSDVITKKLIAVYEKIHQENQ